MEDFQSITNLIKHKERTIILSFLDIGRALIKVRHNKLYKDKYSDMNNYIANEFSFNARQGEKYITVAQEYSSLSSDSNTTRKLGIEKMYILTFVPEMKREELIKETIEQDYTVKELKEKINDEQVEESYQVETNDEAKERQQKYYNQAIIFIDELSEIKSAFNAIKNKIKEWMDESKSYTELETIRNDLIEGLESVKIGD